MPTRPRRRPCPARTTTPAISGQETATLNHHPTPHRNGRRRAPAFPALLAVCVVAVGLLALAPPAWAAGPSAPSLNSVIDALRLWLVGILAGLATLFLTIGGIRYLTANGDPAQVERAKVALKSAAIGYVLAALAPLLVSILQSVVGG